MPAPERFVAIATPSLDGNVSAHYTASLVRTMALMHERGVRVYDAKEVFDRCSCSRDKIKGVLKGFSADEIKASQENGEIAVTCEFCSTTYRFEPAELQPAE